jgi:hypothetical protein
MAIHAAVPCAPTTGTLTLLELPDTGYRLKKPIMAQVERDAGGYVVSENLTGAFHYDPDLSRAIAGFVHAFVQEFELLQRNAGKLSPALTTELEKFSTLLELCPK